MLAGGTPAAAAAEYDSNLDKTFNVAGPGKLTIEADRGSIAVKTSATDAVQVRVLRRVKGGARENATELFTNHEVTFSQDGNSIGVTAKNKRQSRDYSSSSYLDVRYEISAPRSFDVNLKTSGGDIVVGELDGTAILRTSSGTIDLAKAGGKVEAGNSGGDIKLGDAASDVIATTSSGSIKLAKVKGNVEAKNSGGDINIVSAAGAIKASTSSGSIHIGLGQGKSVILRNSGGDIEVGGIAGDASAETSSGSIKIKSVKGELSAKNSGGDIIIGDGDAINAQTSSGSIRIQKATGAVSLKNSGGDVSVQEAGGATTASTSSGTIHLGRALGKVDAKNSGGNISVDEARDAVIARTSSGEINVTFMAGPRGESRLEVSGGGIKVGLPASAGVDLDAQSSGGEVITSVPVTVVVEGKRKNGLQGKINGGGPPLILRSSSGDIRISETLKR
jgi:DUF4097 and DUF4098 domain-containing protein YvlB